MIDMKITRHPFEKLQDVSFIATQIVESGMATDPCIVFEFDPVDNHLWLDCFTNALRHHTEQLSEANTLWHVYEHQVGIKLFEEFIASWTHLMSVELPQDVAYQAGLTYPSAYLIYQAANLYLQRLSAESDSTLSGIMEEYVRKMEEHEFSPLLTRMVANIYFARTLKHMFRNEWKFEGLMI
jgi:hypothetical protein